MRTSPQFPELGKLLKEARTELSKLRLDQARGQREARWNKPIPDLMSRTRVFKASPNSIVLAATGEPDAGHKLYDLESGYVRSLESSHAFIERIIEYYGINDEALASIDYYGRMEELRSQVRGPLGIKRPIYLDPLRKNGGKSRWG